MISELIFDETLAGLFFVYTLRRFGKFRVDDKFGLWKICGDF